MNQNTFKVKKWFGIFLSAILVFMPNFASAFSFEFVQQSNYAASSPAGLISGLWHGMIAPWSLIARWFFEDVGLYAFSNTGWFYDAGFLIGAGGSIPLGWLAAIIATIAMFV